MTPRTVSDLTLIVPGAIRHDGCRAVRPSTIDQLVIDAERRRRPRSAGRRAHRGRTPNWSWSARAGSPPPSAGPGPTRHPTCLAGGSRRPGADRGQLAPPRVPPARSQQLQVWARRAERSRRPDHPRRNHHRRGRGRRPRRPGGRRLVRPPVRGVWSIVGGDGAAAILSAVEVDSDRHRRRRSFLAARRGFWPADLRRVCGWSPSPAASATADALIEITSTAPRRRGRPQLGPIIVPTPALREGSIMTAPAPCPSWPSPSATSPASAQRSQPRRCWSTPTSGRSAYRW